jgi:hypothetical protein
MKYKTTILLDDEILNTNSIAKYTSMVDINLHRFLGYRYNHLFSIPNTLSPSYVHKSNVDLTNA